MADVALIQMPFIALERPSIALGLLSAALKARGLSTKSIYANLSLCDEIGLDAYELIGTAPIDFLIGERLFSHVAFSDGRSVPLQTVNECAEQLAHSTAAKELLHYAIRLRGLASAKDFLQLIMSEISTFVEATAERICDAGIRIVGCTSLFQQHVASLALLREVKRRDPSVVTIIGGSNCSGPMGLATRNAFNWIDYVVTGEFDNHAADFFEGLLDRPTEMSRFLPPGVLAREQPALQIAGQTSTESYLVRDLDSTQIPDYDDYFDELARSNCGQYISPTLMFESSRGCWWGEKHHCTFCGLNKDGMLFRSKSPTRIKQEIDFLTNRYDVHRLMSVDNIIDNSLFKSVLPSLQSGPKRFEIFYETKANLTKGQVETFAGAGVRWIQPGIESLSDEALKLIKKGTSANKNIKLLKDCLESGVHPSWNILTGLPAESLESVEVVAQLLPLLFHLPPPIGATRVRYDRFSPYFNWPGEHDLVVSPAPAYKKAYPGLDNSALYGIAYFFIDLNREHKNWAPVESVSRLIQEMNACIKQWRRTFWGDQRCELTIIEENEKGVLIKDTRPVAQNAFHQLTGLDADIHRLLDSPCLESQIHQKLKQQDATRELDECAVAGAVQRLIDAKLVVRAGEHCIALACRPSTREMVVPHAGPFGNANVERYVRDRLKFAVWMAS